jgi:hypothetical protein
MQFNPKRIRKDVKVGRVVTYRKGWLIPMDEINIKFYSPWGVYIGKGEVLPCLENFGMTKYSHI